MNNAPYAVQFTRERGGSLLRANVTGQRTLEATIAYWEAILEHVQAQRPRWLFVCDQLEGNELSAEEWRKLVLTMAGRGLEGLRIAHVKPNGLDHIEYCEIYAREAGIDARAFADGAAADRWLRYGAEDP